MRAILVLFVIMPILEMVVLIKVGGIIGVIPTIGLVLLTAMLGLALLRQQGFSTLFRAQEKMASGQLPVNELVEGIFLAVGGALLLTPGFVTDAFGFCCLIPGIRQLIISKGITLLRPNVVVRQSHHQSEHHRTIDGEFKRED